MPNPIVKVPIPINEVPLHYAPDSKERKSIKKELAHQSSQIVKIPLIIDGKEVFTERTEKVYMPHDHSHVLAEVSIAGEKELKYAVRASLNAKEKWYALPWEHRTSIFLRASELLAGPWRSKVIAATMLGQSKTVFQAELDAACMVIDALKYYPQLAQDLYATQPQSSKGIYNRIEYRPLDGFVAAVSPFNMSALAVNLVLAPAVMGNTVVWKPSPTSVLSNYYHFKLLEAAGLPKGVVNFVSATGPDTSEYLVKDPHMAGFHFTGSTKTFSHVWKLVGENIERYQSYPRLVGETGGKGLVFAHSSANIKQLVVGIIRGGLEFQGQKCAAASRVFIPRSLWPQFKQMLLKEIAAMKVGSPDDLSTFMNAVIDSKAYEKITNYIEYARAQPDAEIICGSYDNSKGWFVSPHVIVTTNRQFKTLKEEIFGPVITVYIYEDEAFEEELIKVCGSTDYALSAAIYATEREALAKMELALKDEAGNLYINEKPTGSQVGHQPFGGGRASGTNDKTGSIMNLIRWTSPRTIKEVFLPPEDVNYPHQETETQ